MLLCPDHDLFGLELLAIDGTWIRPYSSSLMRLTEEDQLRPDPGHFIGLFFHDIGDSPLVQGPTGRVIVPCMSKHPNKSREAELRRDLLVYLIDEVEKVIERDDPDWDGATAEAIQLRLDKIMTKVRKKAAKLGDV